MATKTYVVKCPKLSYGKADEDGKLLRKAKDYLQGEKIDLDDGDAKPLIEAGAIEPAAEEKKTK